MTTITNTSSAADMLDLTPSSPAKQAPSEIIHGAPLRQGGTPAAIVALSKNLALDARHLDGLRDNHATRLADAKDPAQFQARYDAHVDALKHDIRADSKELRSDLKKIDLRA